MTLRVSCARTQEATEKALDAGSQFAAEIDYMATCTIEGKTPGTSGDEGVIDHVLMEAIYRAAATGTTVKI